MNHFAQIKVVQGSGIYPHVEEYLNWMLMIGRSEHTHRRYQSALRAFIVWCESQGHHELSALSRSTLNDFRKFLYEYRKSTGLPLTKGSLNSKLTPLKKFIQWCARERLIQNDFAHDMDIPRKPRGIPTIILMHDTIEYILQQPDIHTPEGLRDRAIMEILYSTAIRRSEINFNAFQDVDPLRQTIKINKGKNSRERFVPVSERALGWVMQYLKTARPVLASHSSDPALFLTREGAAFLPGTLGSRVKNYIRQAGVNTRGSCHLFRHATATQMLENGADIRYIQALLGHVNLNTTEIYTRVTIKKLREVHRRTHPTTAP